MTKAENTAKRRLCYALADRKRTIDVLNERGLSINDEVFPWFIGDSLFSIRQPDIDDEKVWNKRARDALATHFSGEPYLARAFEAFQYDAADPLAWRKLATTLAYCLFPTPKKPGRKPEWTGQRYIDLFQDTCREKQKAQSASAASDRAVLGRLKKLPQYKKYSVDTLIKALQKARTAEHNPEIAAHLSEMEVLAKQIKDGELKERNRAMIEQAHATNGRSIADYIDNEYYPKIWKK